MRQLFQTLSLLLRPHDKIDDDGQGSNFMSTAKAEVTSMLATLPDDASLEDIQYHLYVLEKVKRGVERADQDGILEHENVKSRLDKWLKD